MHRLFLDANVLFSAAYGSTGLLKLWNLARAGEAVLLSSSYAIEEARRNLGKREQLCRLDELVRDVTLVPEAPADFFCPVALPEKDKPVLAAAIQAGATHFLTGDLRHFGPYRGRRIDGVAICTPRDYLTKRKE